MEREQVRRIQGKAITQELEQQQAERTPEFLEQKKRRELLRLYGLDQEEIYRCLCPDPEVSTP
ncbi:MAG: hypothetical protein HQM12_09665 [SAR324 cluster bacterium]|nr:hypothetical protein [SAR324 cluster bacterium]